MCEHKWMYQYSDYKKQPSGSYYYELSKIDTYYCEKCLEVKEKISKMESLGRNDSYPYWWENK